MPDYIMHYGVKGMKWGVRRYRYADGTLTPAGKKRYQGGNGFNRTMRMKMTELVNTARTQITGKQYVDGFIKEGTTLARIQSSENFNKFAVMSLAFSSDGIFSFLVASNFS